MARAAADVVICVLILGSIAVVNVLTHLLRFAFDNSLTAVPGRNTPFPNETHDIWVLRLVLNLLGYATIFVPGYLIFQYVKKNDYMERAGVLPSLVRQCFSSSDSGERPSELQPLSQHSRSMCQDTILLLFCFFGLQGSYLTWGILQEKIMTKEYVDANGIKGHFKDSQFLVFVNRILAFALTSCYLLLERQGRHTAPLYKYAFCSFSNILSSWCQYEALKYVSFPTQVLAKASKIIPVMAMGKIVSRAKYEYYEYVTALLISVGMGLFLWGAGSGGPDGGHSVTNSSLSGIILLAAYLIADSFTSNWQGALFQQYHMSSVQMMCGVNLFSCIFLSVSLLQQGSFGPSIYFMTQFYQFTFDCLVLSVCSAAGQLFIFYTIFNYGAVVFAIIMTIRQGFAIVLSWLIYQHDISALGAVGIFIVFFAVFLRLYCSHRLKAIHRRRTLAAMPIKV